MSDLPGNYFIIRSLHEGGSRARSFERNRLTNHYYTVDIHYPTSNPTLLWVFRSKSRLKAFNSLSLEHVTGDIAISNSGRNRLENALYHKLISPNFLLNLLIDFSV